MVHDYRRPVISVLLASLSQRAGRLVIVAGPRRVGKTSLVHQALADCGLESDYWATDDPGPWIGAGDREAITAERPGIAADAEALVARWNAARQRAKASTNGFVLAIDEIQKIPRWSEIVKGLWDADRAADLNLHVILLGSLPLLMLRGMTENLMGRYKLVRLSHWSFLEMYEAFQFSIEDYLYFGGYPEAAAYIRERESQWRESVITSLITPSIERDILLMTRIDKPALLRRAFELGCAHSGQILSYTKMVGLLSDAGNTVTIAHYLDLLGHAGFLVGLQKYSGSAVRRRASPPKLNVLNPCFMAVYSGYTKAEALADRTYWGHQVESVVGAHLVNSGGDDVAVYYWREGMREVDFVIEKGPRLTAIEVKSGRVMGSVSGLDEFCRRYPHANRLVVGTGGIALSEFLSQPPEHWLAGEA